MRDSMVASISQRLMEAIQENAKLLYPRETILLLRGETRGNEIKITDLLIPPQATYGRGFTSFPPHMLPIDFSIIGTVHSHPSGSLHPSPTDLNHFYGRMLMIVAPPFRDYDSVAVYDKKGNLIPLEIT
ncbi:Mov34/MPN/PAD-1 family protein [Candidatus Bathyarchaeota archaeon]|nr:Mov34/MPN/PAD-1 family protein [Candidatus Bathyarchaeota archaeon]MBS7630501.1 Mov34/MPN/PAD-1 family protein [Candidatus Bathyarchaeota archaeon]